MFSLQRRIRHSVLHVVAHPRLTLLLAGILLVASIVLARWKLGISSDESRLFSTKVKHYREFIDFEDKFPENDALYVIIEPLSQKKIPPIARWIALADEITEKLRAMPAVVEAVESHVPLEKMGPQGILFDDNG